MTPRCPLCGGVVIGAHFHGIDPEQRCDACDTLAGLRGAAVCACSLTDLRRALAEQAAGEAERTAQAVAAEREACARIADRRDQNAYGIACEIRARATSPAPEPVAAERAVVEAAVAWHRADRTADTTRALLDACDALAAVRKGGG